MLDAVRLVKLLLLVCAIKLTMYMHTQSKTPTLQGFVKTNAPQGSTVVTDNLPAYRGLSGSGYKHITINHSVGEYIKDQAHTNGIESFWSLLKRGYIGIYHYMSAKHLHCYVNEFSYRHNTSDYGTMDFIGATVVLMGGKRLTYKELING